MYSYLMRFSKPHIFKRTLSSTSKSKSYPSKNLNPLVTGLFVTFACGAIGIKLINIKTDEKVSYRYGCHGHPNNLKTYQSNKKGEKS